MIFWKGSIWAEGKDNLIRNIFVSRSSLLNQNKGQYFISYAFSALAEVSGKQINTIIKVIKKKERDESKQ